MHTHTHTQAWVGHPYCDIIDNTTHFESKIRRVIEVVCRRLGSRLGVDIDDRLQAQSRKRKFLVTSVPDIKARQTAPRSWLDGGKWEGGEGGGGGGE